MSSRAVARLVLGSLAAAGAVTIAVHLAAAPTEPAPASVTQSTVVEGGFVETYGGVATPEQRRASRTVLTGGAASAQAVLESVVPQRAADRGPVPADLSGAADVIPGFEKLGPVHVDPAPEGVSLDDPTDTASLYAAAGLDVAQPQFASDEGQGLTSAASIVPTGNPSTTGLSQHVAPSCTGTGTDGRRVQVLYLREATTPSRYAGVLPLLRNEVANVDDVFALSAQQTGGDRRVRWVHDGDCLPVIEEVVVPGGTLSSDFGATIEALDALGYDDPSRKYLSFTDASDLCGVGTLYEDPSLSNNANDGRYASYARVDVPCWSTSQHSVAAHELTHNLGSVLPGAPNVTSNNHCTDDADLMCYNDGSGATVRKVCGLAQEQLLDCNHDDYFNTAPRAGSFLADHWNTASSSFLDRGAGASVAAPEPLTVSVTPSSATAQAGQLVTLRATSAAATGYRWTASRACSLSGASSATVSLQCSAEQQGEVVATVTASDAGGRTASASATVLITVPAQTSTTPTGATLPTGSTDPTGPTDPTGSTGPTDPTTLVVPDWSAPKVTSRQQARISAVLTDAATGEPLTGAPVVLEMRADRGDVWRPVVADLITGSDGSVRVERRRTTAAWYRFTHLGGDTLDGTTSAASSRDVFVKAATLLRADWRARRHVVVGRVLQLDGSPVADVRVTLQRKLGRSGAWVDVRRATSSATGRLVVKQRPRRTAYYRWVYDGDELLLGTHSHRVRARR